MNGRRQVEQHLRRALRQTDKYTRGLVRQRLARTAHDNLLT